MPYQEDEQQDVRADVDVGKNGNDTVNEQTVEDLKQAVVSEKERADANLAGWQRAAADFANYRKRSEQERNELLKSANADLIRRLLPVIDDMDRAFQSIPADATGPWVEGLRLIERKFHSILEQEGVSAYESVGQDFDPTVHEAVTAELTAPENDGKVIGEIQKGYRMRDRVLRPALVRVGRGRTE